jgi:beta-alanine degradation protein BauB
LHQSFADESLWLYNKSLEHVHDFPIVKPMNTLPDPTQTNPEKYKIIFENDQVRVLEYRDQPGNKTAPHHHSNSVMYTLSSFERELTVDGQTIRVQKAAGEASWLPEQNHIGHNIGNTDTHVLFVELKK